MLNGSEVVSLQSMLRSGYAAVVCCRFRVVKGSGLADSSGHTTHVHRQTDRQKDRQTDRHRQTHTHTR